MKLFAWCDSPTAPTGFGRSSKHVLHALHAAGWEIHQLAVNHDPSTAAAIPWRVYMPTQREGDAYGIRDLPQILHQVQPDVFWSTFDPEVPWKYGVKLPNGQEASALDVVRSLRSSRPGFKMVGWFPVDGGPLSDMELAVLGLGQGLFDVSVTMSPHVHDLIAWTVELKHAASQGGRQKADRGVIEKALRVIPHGVELDGYTLTADEERRQAKAALGLDPDGFAILQLERNQQRKQNYLALEVLEMLKQRALPKRVQLYQHLQPDEENQGCMVGYNLPEMVWRYGLKLGEDVLHPAGFVSEAELMLRYRAADVFLSVSTGEGFQYPAWEALAMGVPLVVPNDSARAAWFKDVPNVHLYDVDQHRLVLRGGYCRRMSYPKPAAAATVLRKMVLGKEKYRPKAEAGRAFVERTADVRAVQAEWVELMAEQRDALIAERKESKVALPGSVQYTQKDLVDHVTMLPAPGLGDLVMAGPGLRFLRQSGRKVRLVVAREQLEVAKQLDLADEYSPVMPNHPGYPELELLADRVIHLGSLYHPLHRNGWSDPEESRPRVIARELGIPDDEELPDLEVELSQGLVEGTRSKFLDEFGVDPSTCVGLAFQSGSPHRSLPDTYLPQMVPHLKGLDATPVLLGSRAMNVRQVGLVDLTGQTDAQTLLGLLSNFAAVIAVDSSILHLAQAVGCPTVGAYSLFAPETRRVNSSTPLVPVLPESPVGDEAFPAGIVTKAPPGAWTATLRPGRLAAALRELLGLGEQAAPQLVVPQ